MSDKHLAISAEFQIKQSRKVKRLEAENGRLRAERVGHALVPLKLITEIAEWTAKGTGGYSVYVTGKLREFLREKA